VATAGATKKDQDVSGGKTKRALKGPVGTERTPILCGCRVAAEYLGSAAGGSHKIPAHGHGHFESIAEPIELDLRWG
jgi:hypothetical protein